MDPFLGEIRMFGGNFAPRGWALCNGQLMSVAQNTALFSILGVTYGGNGQTTFGLPNMQGRLPMHWGSGPGLSPHTLGEASGTETVTLINSQMPMHNHQLIGTTAAAGDTLPTGNILSEGNSYAAGNSTPTNMSPNAIGVSGGNQPHTNMPPYLAVSFIIALEGVFPSRN